MFFVLVVVLISFVDSESRVFKIAFVRFAFDYMCVAGCFDGSCTFLLVVVLIIILATLGVVKLFM